MRNLILVLSIVFVSSLALAKGKGGIGPAGCGLGNQIFGTESQIFAATTNGSSGTQTFGITSGTSNCVDSSGTAKLEAFVEANQVALANDAARGSGETIGSLSKILGCDDVMEVNSALKSNYEQVFRTEKSSDISSSIREVLKSSGARCDRLG